MAVRSLYREKQVSISPKIVNSFENVYASC